MSTRQIQTYDGNGKLVDTRTYNVSAQQDNLESLFQRAATALQANQNFLALAAPTNAQVLAQVTRLTRQMDALIRLLVTADLTDISDT